MENETNSINDFNKTPLVYDHDSSHIHLPCKAEDFKDFVSKLLGKPQKLTREFKNCSYILDSKTIEDITLLIQQRIDQQNSSALLSFDVSVSYTDGSSAAFDGFEHFLNYRELRPAISNKLFLSWTYLIKFPGKQTPEKQVIEIEFSSERMYDDTFHDLNKNNNEQSPGQIKYFVHYTERTWASDIESLLLNYIRKLIQKPTKFEAFLDRNTYIICSLNMILLSCLCIYTIYISFAKFQKENFEKISKLTEHPQFVNEEVINKLNYLLELYLSGLWVKNFILLIFFVLILLSVMYFSTILIKSRCKYSGYAFITLTDESENELKRYEREKNSPIQKVIFTFIVNIIVGISANALFLFIFSQR